MRGELADRLRALEREGLRRSLLSVSAARSGAEVEVAGRRVINLASNDYLGLAGHAELCQAAARAAESAGVGAGGARLVTGTLDLHLELERALAGLLGVEGALLFGSGYLAHLGAIPALLLDAQDAIYSDELNHASIVDACRLARAEVRVYRHCDVAHLESLLAHDAERGGRRLVISETIFSMDGDAAPLDELCTVAQRYGAWLMVDEAHAFGIRGATGAGLVAELSPAQQQQVHVRMGTLGKAAGSYGAFIGGSAELIDYLINRARTFIYSTALPAPVIAAARAAIALIEGAEGARRRLALQSAAAQLRAGLLAQGWELGPVPGPILPLFVRDPRRATALAAALLEHGVLARAMRYPTVPRGTERLRLVVSAAHTTEQVDHVLAAFAQLQRRRG